MIQRNLNSCETTTTNHEVTKWAFSMSQKLLLQEEIEHSTPLKALQKVPSRQLIVACIHRFKVFMLTISQHKGKALQPT
jgi:hypothetical protein